MVLASTVGGLSGASVVLSLVVLLSLFLATALYLLLFWMQI